MCLWRGDWSYTQLVHKDKQLCKIKPEKNSGWTGFKPMTSAILDQLSNQTNCNKFTNKVLKVQCSHTLRVSIKSHDCHHMAATSQMLPGPSKSMVTLSINDPVTSKQWKKKILLDQHALKWSTIVVLGTWNYEIQNSNRIRLWTVLTVNKK